MSTYKKGDRVEVTNPDLSTFGKQGTVLGDMEIACAPASEVRIDGLDFDAGYKWTSLAPAPAPALIIIDRNDLPEVVEDMGVLKCDGTYYSAERIGYYRENAAKYLALAEFLEARERQAAEDAAAAKVGEQVMQKRRDELAREIAKTSCFVRFESFTYEDHVRTVQVAIDMLITEQDKNK